MTFPSPVVDAPADRPVRRATVTPARTGWGLPLGRQVEPVDISCSAADPSGVPLDHPAVRAHLHAQFAAAGHHPQDYLPDEPGVPAGGGWLLVADTTGLNRYADQLLRGWKVPAFSLWFGVPLPTTDIRTPATTAVLPYSELRTDARDRAMTRRFRAPMTVIDTPGGQAWLWPHELLAVTRKQAARLLGLPGHASTRSVTPTSRHRSGSTRTGCSTCVRAGSGTPKRSGCFCTRSGHRTWLGPRLSDRAAVGPARDLRQVKELSQDPDAAQATAPEPCSPGPPKPHASWVPVVPLGVRLGRGQENF